jgi:KUP system potassium uptake protein
LDATDADLRLTSFMSSVPATQSPVERVKLALCLGALGVVFGDIGTSPLYALRESVSQLPATDQVMGVFGVLSLIFWSLLIVVCLKYITFVTRADNRGEGGVFSLFSLGHFYQTKGRRGIGVGVLVILVGAAMLCGEGVITPAISVLSAAEGIKLLVPGAEPFVVPLAVVVLVGIFWFQSKGSMTIGRIYGPVMLVWFISIGLLGLVHIVKNPAVLQALNPWHGLHLLATHPAEIGLILGGVVLSITGVEAIFADMGHFGRKAIQRAWYFVAMPGLVLNYFGQGAYVLSHPEGIANPFLGVAPAGVLRVSLMILSVLAAIIASQAMISGTFSLIRQAMQLGFFPRLKVLHTSSEQSGQIYIPLINTFLALGSIATVLGFRSSSNLASAYGIAVTSAMTVTTFALYFVAIHTWKWPRWQAAGLCLLFGLIDVIFLLANAHKIVDGGWLPLAISAGLLAVMHTWKSGRNEIQEKVYGGAITELELSSIARSKNIVRVQGGAIFMVATPKGTPLALLHHLKANKCLQHTVVLLTITTEDVPQVPDEDRFSLDNMGEGVWRAIGRYGYMESPDVSKLVERIRAQGVPVNLQATTFYFNREMIITGGDARMFEWQKALYAFLSRNARPVKDYYRILPTQIIEIGLPVQL